MMQTESLPPGWETRKSGELYSSLPDKSTLIIAQGPNDDDRERWYFSWVEYGQKSARYFGPYNNQQDAVDKAILFAHNYNQKED